MLRCISRGWDRKAPAESSLGPAGRGGLESMSNLGEMNVADAFFGGDSATPKCYALPSWLK